MAKLSFEGIYSATSFTCRHMFHLLNFRQNICEVQLVFIWDTYSMNGCNNLYRCAVFNFLVIYGGGILDTCLYFSFYYILLCNLILHTCDIVCMYVVNKYYSIQCCGLTASYCISFSLDHLEIAEYLGTPLSDLSACCFAVVMCYITDAEV
jgi:hypothetical protein